MLENSYQLYCNPGSPRPAGMKRPLPPGMKRFAVMHVCHRTLMPVQETYGKKDAVKWWVRWRVFYLACSELFAYDSGNQWGVGHFVFAKK